MASPVEWTVSQKGELQITVKLQQRWRKRECFQYLHIKNFCWIHRTSKMSSFSLCYRYCFLFYCKHVTRFHYIFCLHRSFCYHLLQLSFQIIRCSYRIYCFIFGFQRASAVIKLKLLNISEFPQ